MTKVMIRGFTFWFLFATISMAHAAFVEGRLLKLVSDEVAGSRVSYGLEQIESGRVLPLLSPVPSAASAGDRIRIKGELTPEGIRFSPPDVSVLERSTSSPVRSGPIRTLYIIVNFQDNPLVPVSPADLRRIIFEMPRSVARFYEEASFGQVRIEGDVVGVYTLPVASNGRCDDSDWMARALAIARAEKVPVDSYTDHVLIFPEGDSKHKIANTCGFHGVATVGANPNYAWINYNDGFDWGPETAARVIAHEQGHNFGLAHACALLCNQGNTTLGTPAQCKNVEYGDSTDDMGNQYEQFSALHKAALGWIKPWQVRLIAKSGIYDVMTSDRFMDGVQLLKIEKPDTHEFYYVSYRTNEGVVDYGFGSGQGVYVHVWDGGPASSTHVLFVHPTLPIGGAMVDPLLDGERIVDSVNQLVIRELRHDRDRAEVSIQFGLSD